MSPLFQGKLQEAGKTPPARLENTAGRNWSSLGHPQRRYGRTLHLNCLSLDLQSSINPENGFQTICSAQAVKGLYLVLRA